MPKFSDLNLDQMKTDLDKEHAAFMAEMEAIRISAQIKIDAASVALDQMLSELRQFDIETKNAFNKGN